MVQREIYFKDLAHVIVGIGEVKIFKAGQQAGNSGRSFFVCLFFNRRIMLFRAVSVSALRPSALCIHLAPPP